MSVLANLDDINANLPSDEIDPVVEATDENTAIIQISAARIIRGYLARVIDNVTLQSWRTPDTTPDIIREIAGKLIASQLFFNKTAGQSTELAERSIAQLLYDQAIAMLNQIVIGEIVIEDVVITATDRMSELDFFPVDDTDRAFTMGMNL